MIIASELPHNSRIIHNFRLMPLHISGKQNAIIGCEKPMKCIDLFSIM